MGITFNADEILGMAVRIEQNGAKFYRKAAKGAGGAAVRDRLLELAQWEEQHEKTFAGIRAQVAAEQKAPTAYDPDDQGALYLQAMADGHVFDVKADPAAKLTGRESLPDILKTALGLEKDSIVFYLGLEDLVPAKLGRDKVQAILKEEMRHVAVLSQELGQVK